MNEGDSAMMHGSGKGEAVPRVAAWNPPAVYTALLTTDIRKPPDSVHMLGGNIYAKDK